MTDLSAWLQGFLLGLGMFICPGPKDVLILREALAGRSPFMLVGIGVASDIVLIALGILGLSAALQQAPALQQGAQLRGIGLLVLHGVLAARNVVRGAHPRADASVPSDGRGLQSLLLCRSSTPPLGWTPCWSSVPSA